MKRRGYFEQTTNNNNSASLLLLIRRLIVKKVSLDVWIQLLGMTGIIVSLNFVAMQMRQSQTIAVAGQIQAKNQMLLENQLAVFRLRIYRQEHHGKRESKRNKS